LAIKSVTLDHQKVWKHFYQRRIIHKILDVNAVHKKKIANIKELSQTEKEKQILLKHLYQIL